MTFREGLKKSFEQRGMRLLLLFVAAGFGAILYRMVVGLGAATNLSDDLPWGLWVAVDVLVGVALAAGGFSITAAVYIFNMKKYRPIVRPAILTTFIGYAVVVVGLVVDIGKPLSAWHPVVMWHLPSVMFEVVWCIILYLTVLALEFSETFFEGMKWEKAYHTIKKFIYPLVIAGITLSFLHQSSLGGVFLIAPAKLSHLWWTTNIPYFFYLSAIAAGLAMVSVEAIVSSRTLKRQFEMEILQGLARGTVITLGLYLVLKIADLAAKGNLGLVFAGDKASLFFLLEMLIGVVVPIALYLTPAVKKSVNGLLTAASLVVTGVVVNRFNVNFFAQAGTGAVYFPSVFEIVVTMGLVALVVLLYRLAVMHLPVFPEGALSR